MIGGLEPCSFIDFPGCLSAVVFLRGCNLRCPFCHNAALIKSDGPRVMEGSEIIEFLASRRGRLDGVVFSGGEPTLQRGLPSLIEAARGLGFKIKLDTNGTRPELLSELLGDALLDYVALDLKDEPTAYARWLGMLEGPEVLLRSLDLIKASGVDHELRTTVVRPYHDEERLSRMARWAAGCRRWVLQSCRSDARPRSFRLDLSREAGLEELASQLRERHGVPCRCRSERSRVQSCATPDTVRQREEARPWRHAVSDSWGYPATPPRPPAGDEAG